MMLPFFYEHFSDHPFSQIPFHRSSAGRICRCSDPDAYFGNGVTESEKDFQAMLVDSLETEWGGVPVHRGKPEQKGKWHLS